MGCHATKAFPFIKGIPKIHFLLTHGCHIDLQCMPALPALLYMYISLLCTVALSMNQSYCLLNVWGMRLLFTASSTTLLSKCVDGSQVEGWSPAHFTRSSLPFFRVARIVSYGHRSSETWVFFLDFLGWNIISY